MTECRHSLGSVYFRVRPHPPSQSRGTRMTGQNQNIYRLQAPNLDRSEGHKAPGVVCTAAESFTDRQSQERYKVECLCKAAPHGPVNPRTEAHNHEKRGRARACPLPPDAPKNGCLRGISACWGMGISCFKLGRSAPRPQRVGFTQTPCGVGFRVLDFELKVSDPEIGIRSWVQGLGSPGRGESPIGRSQGVHAY